MEMKMSKKQNNKNHKNQNSSQKPFMKAALSRKSFLVNTAANIGISAFVGAKAGVKAGLATAALGTAWSVASAAYWESIDRERNEHEKNNPPKDPKDNQGPKP
jgi:hypothetical protein